MLVPQGKEVFTTTLDAFRGNSGSAVISTVTHEMVGILKGGDDDFELDTEKKYLRPKVYRFTEVVNGLYNGENVQRITAKLTNSIKNLLILKSIVGHIFMSPTILITMVKNIG